VAIDAVSAVVEWWQATPAIRLLTADGLIHDREAPGNAALPYAVVFKASGPTEDLNTGDGYTLTETVQVSYYATTAEQAASGADAIRRALRFATLTIGGRTTAEVFLAGGDSDKFSREGIDAVDVFFESRDFEITWPV
jgi:hypothetical protein